MRKIPVLLLLSAALCSAQSFDSFEASTVMVPMRDGVKLSTDVYLPARGGKAAEERFPVLIYRTPYDKKGNRNPAAFFTSHGYAVISQDVRGRYASEGTFYPFVNEGLDGYDTIEWAAAQKWSDGKVGTIGSSYVAWDQYLASMYRPPHLVAMFTNVGGATFFDEFGHPGGTPNLGWPMWILGSAITSPQAANNPEGRERLSKLQRDPGPWLAEHPEKRGRVFDEFPVHRKIYQDFYAHSVFDNYWKHKGFYTAGYHREMKDVPTFFISGWYDYFAEGVLDNFSALSRMHKSMKKLWMGPWPHGVGASSCGDAGFGPQAAVRVNEIALDWFDHWMKNKPFQRIGPEPVRIFRMGGGDGKRGADGKMNHGGEWMTATAWPPVSAGTVSYYIRSGGMLATERPKNEAASTFVYDPANPVPTIGGRFGLGSVTPLCAQDQVCSPKILGCVNSDPLNQRADVLSFSTEPLSAPLDITGEIRATVWASTDAPDTDFTVKLVDVYPEGYALIVADGQIRASYREGREKIRPVKPGKAYEFNLDLGSTSNRFATGHRIRVDISSSNYPKFEPNPNTGEPAARWTRRQKARNTIYHQARRTSSIELPVASK